MENKGDKNKEGFFLAIKNYEKDNFNEDEFISSYYHLINEEAECAIKFLKVDFQRCFENLSFKGLSNRKVFDFIIEKMLVEYVGLTHKSEPILDRLWENVPEFFNEQCVINSVAKINYKYAQKKWDSNSYLNNEVIIFNIENSVFFSLSHLSADLLCENPEIRQAGLRSGYEVPYKNLSLNGDEILKDLLSCDCYIDDFDEIIKELSQISLNEAITILDLYSNMLFKNTEFDNSPGNMYKKSFEESEILRTVGVWNNLLTIVAEKNSDFAPVLNEVIDNIRLDKYDSESVKNISYKQICNDIEWCTNLLNNEVDKYLCKEQIEEKEMKAKARVKKF